MGGSKAVGSRAEAALPPPLPPPRFGPTAPQACRSVASGAGAPHHAPPEQAKTAQGFDRVADLYLVSSASAPDLPCAAVVRAGGK